MNSVILNNSLAPCKAERVRVRGVAHYNAAEPPLTPALSPLRGAREKFLIRFVYPAKRAAGKAVQDNKENTS